MTRAHRQGATPASDVFLRALQASDLERTLRWHNDPELYRQLVGPFRFVSPEAEQTWLAKKCAFSSDEVNLAICLEGTGEHIGNIYLRAIDWIARHGEVGIFIAEPARQSRGSGQAALGLLIRHAFGDLGLRRLYLWVLEDNARAIRAYEKCGFAVEGKLRRHVFKHGRLHNLLVMGLCAEEGEQAGYLRPGTDKPQQ